MKLYHGTCDKNLEKIQEKGLCSAKLAGKRAIWIEGHPELIYASKDKKRAFTWADSGIDQIAKRKASKVRGIFRRWGAEDVYKQSCTPIVLEIDTNKLPKSKFKVEREPPERKIPKGSWNIDVGDNGDRVIRTSECIPPKAMRVKTYWGRWKKLESI